jgi:hypothetical protein
MKLLTILFTIWCVLLFNSSSIVGQDLDVDKSTKNDFAIKRQMVASSIDGYSKIFKDVDTVNTRVLKTHCQKYELSTRPYFGTGYFRGYSSGFSAFDAFVTYPLAIDAAINTVYTGAYSKSISNTSKP